MNLLFNYLFILINDKDFHIDHSSCVSVSAGFSFPLLNKANSYGYPEMKPRCRKVLQIRKRLLRKQYKDLWISFTIIQCLSGKRGFTGGTLSLKVCAVKTPLGK